VKDKIEPSSISNDNSDIRPDNRKVKDVLKNKSSNNESSASELNQRDSLNDIETKLKDQLKDLEIGQAEKLLD
jgi:hypothetical protein